MNTQNQLNIPYIQEQNLIQINIGRSQTEIQQE